MTVDGTWETAKGFDNLTEVAGGLSADGDNNICFTLEEAGDVKVTYTSEIFKLEGNFYIEPLPPIVVKDLKLVPGVWKNDGAALYVWAWQDGVEGKWAVFNGEGDTLVAKIQENATKAIFVRFEAGITDPVWDDTKIWNKTDDQEIAECGIFFVNDWDNYSWCSAPEPPQPGEFVDIILVPGVWKEADAKFAAVTFTYMPEHMGPEALKDAVISDWFVANEGGGSFTGRIPKDAKVIGFGRFNPAVEKLTIETVFAEGVMWNHSDIMYIDESMLFTITGWEEGRDYCPGYWGEAPQPGEPVWFLVGDMTEWQKNPISFAAGDIKVNLTDEGRDYGFKILRIIGEKDETWYGNNGTMTREYNQDWIFDAGEQSNCKLTVDVAGEYVFSLVIDGNDTPHVSVTYPNKQGLDDVNSENVVVKTIRNGQVLIIRGEHIYTTVGQMVK